MYADKKKNDKKRDKKQSGYADRPALPALDLYFSHYLPTSSVLYETPPRLRCLCGRCQG